MKVFIFFWAVCSQVIGSGGEMNGEEGRHKRFLSADLDSVVMR
jgi:hypothetical protein